MSELNRYYAYKASTSGSGGGGDGCLTIFALQTGCARACRIYKQTCREQFGRQNNIRKILKKYYNERDEILSWVTVGNKYTANIGIS